MRALACKSPLSTVLFVFLPFAAAGYHFSYLFRTVDCWPADAAGHYPDIAYQVVLALPVGLQLIALLWFARSALVPQPEMPDRAAITPIAVSEPALK
jgi:hypothetical protein